MKLLIVFFNFLFLVSTVYTQTFEPSPFQKECEGAISRFAFPASDVAPLKSLCPLIQNQYALGCLRIAVGLQTPTTSLMMACRKIANDQQLEKVIAIRSRLQRQSLGKNDTIASAQIYAVLNE